MSLQQKNLGLPQVRISDQIRYHHFVSFSTILYQHARILDSIPPRGNFSRGSG